MGIVPAMSRSPTASLTAMTDVTTEAPLAMDTDDWIGPVGSMIAEATGLVSSASSIGTCAASGMGTAARSVVPRITAIAANARPAAAPPTRLRVVAPGTILSAVRDDPTEEDGPRRSGRGRSPHRR